MNATEILNETVKYFDIENVGMCIQKNWLS